MIRTSYIEEKADVSYGEMIVKTIMVGIVVTVSLFLTGCIILALF